MKLKNINIDRLLLIIPFLMSICGFIYMTYMAIQYPEFGYGTNALIFLIIIGLIMSIFIATK